MATFWVAVGMYLLAAWTSAVLAYEQHHLLVAAGIGLTWPLYGLYMAVAIPIAQYLIWKRRRTLS